MVGEVVLNVGETFLACSCSDWTMLPTGITIWSSVFGGMEPLLNLNKPAENLTEAQSPRRCRCMLAEQSWWLSAREVSP